MIDSLNYETLRGFICDANIEITDNLSAEHTCYGILFHARATQGDSFGDVGCIIASAGKGNNVTMVCRIHGLPQRVGSMKYRNFTLMAQRGN